MLIMGSKIGGLPAILRVFILLMGTSFAGIASSNTRIQAGVCDTLIQKSSKRELKEVVVKGKTRLIELRESPLTIVPIDVMALHGRSGDVVALLNQAPGVRLRSDGYVGSAININLNGLQGKAIRLFKDGIPMEIFGHGFDPSLIPSNLLQRIEVYKGVVPISFGADALGGGINFVSRYPASSLADASYEHSSFNTHRASFMGFLKSDSSRFYIGVNTSFSYSDNDYQVTVPLYDLETGATKFAELKRFHDATRAIYMETYAGWRALKWVDQLRLTLIYSSFYKQLQHGVTMGQRPYGEPYGDDQGITSMLSYDKSLVADQLRLNMVLAYSHFDTRLVDTTRARYGWDGHVSSRDLGTRGEINSGNDQRQVFQFYTIRTNLNYKLSSNHTMELNAIYIAKKRVGSDPLGAKDILTDVDVLTVPAYYKKNVLGLGIHSKFLDDRVENMIGVKRYDLLTKGYTSDNYGFVLSRDGITTGKWGFMDALSYRITNRWLSKISYEYATRLSDEFEVFGDSRTVKENLTLKPESSHNLNLQLQYTDNESAGKWSAMANFFYRRVNDMIFLQADIPFSRYINYSNTRVRGIEFDVLYSPFKFLKLGANGTYQDIRRVDIAEANIQYLENSRVPNIPFLFGNTHACFQWNNLFQKKSKVEVYGYANYVHRFFLQSVSERQEPGLFSQPESFVSTLIVPNDGRTGTTLYTAGLVYGFPKNGVSLGFECVNVSNTKIFDNFNVERPGRSFHLKLRYQLAGNNK